MMNIDIMNIMERRHGIRFDQIFNLIILAYEMPKETRGKSKTPLRTYTNSIEALGP